MNFGTIISELVKVPMAEGTKYFVFETYRNRQSILILDVDNQDSVATNNPEE